MPNRILKESICTSENIDQLSPVAETAFYRLMVNCDDYGRMDGRIKVVKSRLFPLKDITEDDMLHLLKELEKADLIRGYEVDGHPYLQMKTWERHQQVRAKRSKYPSPDEIICNQMKSDESKCPRNPIQSESLSESESLSNALIADDDAKQIQSEQNRVLDAAEDAGFQRTNSVRAQLIQLFAEYGLERMLYGIDSCVTHGAPNLAYLRAVLNGNPKQGKPVKVLPAQDFNQRSYEGVNNEIMQQLEKEMAEFRQTHPEVAGA